MANYTPVWPRHRYDQQQDGNGPFEISGTNLFGVFSISSFFTNGTISSPVVCQYSIAEADEIFYFVTYYNGTTKLFAVKANGEKLGGGFTSNAILWTFSDSTIASSTYKENYCISISSDGETIYFSPPYGSRYGNGLTTLFSINASDGTEKWRKAYGSSGVPSNQTQINIISQVVEDSDGNIHFLTELDGFNPTYNFTSITLIKLDPEDGTQLDSININTPTTYCLFNGIPFLATDPSKDYLFTAYYGRQTSGPNPYKAEVVRIPIDYSGIATAIINYDDRSINASISGMAYGGAANIVYTMDNVFGLVRSNLTTGIRDWNFAGTNPSAIGTDVGPAVNDRGEINYRQDNILYTIQSNGTERPSSRTTILPTEDSKVSPILTPDGNIIIASNNYTTSDDNIYVFNDSGTNITYQYSFRNIDLNKYIIYNVSLGDSFGNTNNILYQPIYDTTTGTGYIYLAKSSLPPTTTTTSSTTTTTPTTTTTTTTGTGTTTTTTPTTTTTTTTTPAPLSVVETLIIVDVNGQFVEQSASNASDNNQTKGNLFANSLTFGTIAPGETSDNVIVLLNIPNSQAIGNVKLGLIDTGGIEFANNIFGITSENRLDDSVVPTTYFQGVNTSGTASNSNNIAIGNSKSNVSEYVYLNLNLPSGNTLGEGVIKYKWFFDYAD